jgi:hypothetical protein
MRIDGLSPEEQAEFAEVSEIIRNYLQLLKRQVAKIEFTYGGVLDMLAAADSAHRGAAARAVAQKIRTTIVPVIEAAQAYDAMTEDRG